MPTKILPTRYVRFKGALYRLVEAEEENPIASEETIKNKIDALKRLPSVKSGMTRLYRVQSPKRDVSKIPEWRLYGLQESGAFDAWGRWFLDDLSLIDFYIKDTGENAQVLYVDIPTADLEKYRVSNVGPEGKVNPRRFSLDPEKEFFLPKDLAAKAIVVK